MQLVEAILGNSHDPIWQARLKGCTVDELELSQWDAQKNRLRKDTRAGQSIAIVLDREEHLHDGDVLFWDAEKKEAVVCRIALCDVLVIDLSGIRGLTYAECVERCVTLGHALGNQHWPAVVKDGFVYVPMTVNRLVMSSVMNTHHFSGITYSFAAGDDVVKKLTPAEARRLFGGTERPMDGGHGKEHLHGHDHTHGNDHTHHDHACCTGHHHQG